jgi:pimeloyl-ACP methyl ester carboxylesterase
VDYVLVHGGWQGGWCWDGVATHLRAGGNRVFAPTLRGLEEGNVDRSGVDLNAIGEGLIDAIKQQDLEDMVLVGHSGGGPAVQYAADRLAEKTRRVVFVDAWVLRDGEAIHDVLPKPLVEHDREAVTHSVDRTLPMDMTVWTEHLMNGATPETLAAVVDRLVPTPFGWLSEPINLPRFWSVGLPSSYVFLADDIAVPRELYEKMAARLREPRIVECDGPHEAMLTHPEELARALETAGRD